MEKFKSLDEITQMDVKHGSVSKLTGYIPDLKGMHEFLSGEILNEEVPDVIKGQFNVAKNMALYTYYFYALAPEVHLKTYTVIEHALRIKANSKKRLMLKALVDLAIKEKWIVESGFRHLEDSSKDNDQCKSLVKALSKLRNAKAHGSEMLVGHCLDEIAICTDFLNQLFPSIHADSNSEQ